MTDKLISHERAKRSVQNLYDPSNGSEKYCLELVDYILQQEKVTELLGLYQDLFKKLELTVEHDTSDTWAGCVEYNYVEINGGITDEVETVEKTIKLQKELGE